MTATETIGLDDLIDNIEDEFNHEPECSNPHVRVRVGRLGDNLLRCRNCTSWRLVEPWMLRHAVEAADDADGEADEAEPLRPGVVLTSAWRCRIHLDEPVTWRGTGCRECHKATR